jgi:voltage-gated potassium channel
LSDAGLRIRLSAAFDPEMRSEPGLSAANQLVIYGIVASVLVAVLETEPTLVSSMPSFFHIAHFTFFAAFSIEYCARLYAAPVNPKYRSALHYAATPAALVDLVVLLSFLLPYLGLETALLRSLRAARLVRLARLGRYSKAMQLVVSAVAERRYELGLSFVIASALLLASSTGLYFVERAAQPEDFGSIPRAMWWSVATLTTVGYGDIVPVTPLGRFFAALTAITGIGIIALPTGILAGAFSDAIRKSRAQTKDDA